MSCEVAVESSDFLEANEEIGYLHRLIDDDGDTMPPHFANIPAVCRRSVAMYLVYRHYVGDGSAMDQRHHCGVLPNSVHITYVNSMMPTVQDFVLPM